VYCSCKHDFHRYLIICSFSRNNNNSTNPLPRLPGPPGFRADDILGNRIDHCSCIHCRSDSKCPDEDVCGGSAKQRNPTARRATTRCRRSRARENSSSPPRRRTVAGPANLSYGIGLSTDARDVYVKNRKKKIGPDP